LDSEKDYLYMRINYYLTLKIALGVLVTVGLIALASTFSRSTQLESSSPLKQEKQASSKAGNNEQAPTRISVRVERLKPFTGFSFQTIPGTTRAAERAVVRSQVAGKVLIRNVRQGQTVNANEVLITLYNPEASPLAQSAYDSRQ